MSEGKSKQPLVSVCVTCYNYGRFIADCIESVQAQTLSDWELIICDDQSSDNTAEIVRQYAAQDNRIKYLINETRLGMNGNIKRSADLGTGKYLKILCADDWLAPNCLEVLVALMEQHPNVVLATSAEVYTDHEEPLHVQFLFGKPLTIISGAAMLDRVANGHGLGGNSSFLIRKSAYKEIGGYDDRVLYAADYDLGARLCRIGDYLHVDEPLFYGRHHEASSSSNDPKKLIDVIDWYEIPDRIFRPRRFGNREWRRYHWLTMQLTARYLLNTILQHLRANHRFANKLAQMVIKYGNLWLGIPWLLPHVIGRLYRRITGKHRPLSLPPEPNMGIPRVWRKAN